MIDLSVIIVTWNCRQYALDCLASIEKGGARRRIHIEILLVDNDSTDGTVEAVRKAFPSVHVTANRTNAGFATANNQAIRESKGRYVLLLNPDTLVNTDALDTMTAYLDANGSVAAIGPTVLNGDGTQQFTGVRFPNTWNFFSESFFLDRFFPRSRLFGRHKSLYEDFSKPFSVDFVQGSCLMVRRSVLDSVGLLDESYFMYFEETDLCYRIKNAGYDIHFVPSASITHFGGGEEGHFTERRLLHYHRSLFLFYRKNHGPASRIAVRFVIALRSLIRIGAWSLTALLRPDMRHKAGSIIIGYCKTFGLIFTE